MSDHTTEKDAHVETSTGCTCGWRLPPSPTTGHGTFSAHRAAVIPPGMGSDS